jgi:protein-tyrosine phosphatase
MFKKIISVCTGNICRSPIAEGLLRERLSGSGIQSVSAGISAMVHYQADPLAQLVMKEHGHDISAHRAQQATLPLLNANDLILAMDQTHYVWLRTNFPHLSGRIYKIGRWRGNLDVEDPYRQPKAVFDQVYELIEACTGDWVSRITSI